MTEAKICPFISSASVLLYFLLFSFNVSVKFPLKISTQLLCAE